MANEFKVKKGLIVQGSGSTLLDIQGSQGQLFSVTDSLSGSLFSVNDISGMPIMEVFSDDRVNLGTFNAEAIKVLGSTATVTGSLFGTASYARQALSASWAPATTTAATASYVLNAVSASFASTASFLNGSTTNAFVQNGNSFGTTALLGTNDNQSLALETNGSTKMFISSSGNVGIGTTSPSDKLDIAGGSIKLANGYKLYDGSTNDSTGLYWDSNQVNISGYSGIIFRSSNSQVASQTERMRITSAGNVLIGTTTDTGYKLYVAGTLRTSGTALLGDATSVGNSSLSWGFPGTYYGQMQNVSSTVYGLGFGASPTAIGTTVLSYDTSGNVGIGTTGPVSIGTGITTLDIEGSGAGGIAFGLSGTKNYIYGASTMYVEANTTAVFATNGSEKMRITSTGEVGIGTTSPGDLLTVNGNIRVIDPGDRGFYGWDAATGGSKIYSITRGTDLSLNDLNINSYAGFGIKVNASTLVKNSHDFYITSTGNIGIGKTSPNAKLDVNGNATITGSLTVTGRITAEEFHTEFVSSSIVYQSGSTKFGDTSDDVMSVTGSLRVNGSITGSLFGTASYATTALNVVNNGVTSVATNNGITGGTITSTGTIGLATAYGDTINPYASKTANYVLAAPNGSAGVPSFRAIVAADIPTLNQNTSGNAATATSASMASTVAITNDTTTNATYYPVFVSATSGNTAARVDSSTLTYNPSTNTLTTTTLAASSLNVSSISLASAHNIYNYSGTLVITATTGTTISLGGGPGSAQNNVNVANGTLAVGNTSPQGKFHVFQGTTLGGTTGNSVILQTLQNTGGSGGNNVYIKDYSLRDATGTSWTTWRLHQSIDIDGSHNTPGTNTKAFYERDPLSGLHEFGQEATYAVTIDGVNSRIGVATRTPSYPIHVNTNVSGTSIYASADIVAYSDESVKENIRPIENVIQRIEQSRGVLYDRTDIESKDNIGFIAQELEVAFPELVVTNEDGTKAVKYQNTVAVLFEAIKEQQKQIDELKQIVNGFTR